MLTTMEIIIKYYLYYLEEPERPEVLWESFPRLEKEKNAGYSQRILSELEDCSPKLSLRRFCFQLFCECHF